jgi:signal transduction histidine kinase
VKYYSLRRRTLRAFALPIGVTILAITLAASVLAYRAIAYQRDREMETSAAVLSLLLRHEALEGDRVGDITGPMFPQKWLGGGIEFRMSAINGKVTQSAGMPNFADAPAEGFSQTAIARRSWRLLRRRQGPTIMVEVAEPLSLRQGMAVDVVASLAVPMVILALILTLIVRRSLTKALAPLHRLSAELDRRDADDLAPVGGEELPQEIHSMVDALNDMLGRLGEAFERERAFSDNAAHELRTPLALLKTRAQLLERRIANDPALAGEVRECVAAVDRAALLIDRMLELVRLSAIDAQPTPVDLSALAQGVARDMALLALDKGLDIAADIAPDLAILGHNEALRSAMRNLIENAIRYTPGGGHITIRLCTQDGAARFSVEDTGIGIAAGEEQAIFRRFHRADRNGPGAGLGLALVETAVRQHRGLCHATRREGGGLHIGFAIPLAL